MEGKQESICRCCLSENGVMKDMQKELFVIPKKRKKKLLSIYSICSGVDIENFENWTNICGNCEKKMLNSYKFREECQSSYKILLKRRHSKLAVKQEILLDEPQTESEPVYPFSQVFVKDGEVAVAIKHEEIHGNESQALEIDDTMSNGSCKSEDRTSDLGSNRYDDDNQNVSSERYNMIELMRGKLICFQCDQILTNVREYVEHQKNHLHNGAACGKVCVVCNEFIPKGYQRHRQLKHKDYRPYECGTCLAKYESFRSLVVHLYSHTGANKFICMAESCGMKFQSPLFLRRHIIDTIKHKINYYHCLNCGQDFPKFLDLNVHFKKVHDKSYSKRLAPCFDCKKVFFNRKTLFDHKCVSVLKCRSKSKVKRNRWGKVVINMTPQTCQQCDKTFENDDEFACHKNSMCREAAEFTCQICQKICVTKQRLKSHLRVHDQHKFICDSCGMSYSSKLGLEAHKKSHSDGRSFKCKLCTADFVTSHNLKVHTRIHQDRNYECDLCGKKFRLYENIKLHMSLHSENLLKFPCEMCEKKFARNCDLKLHTKLFHTNAVLSKCHYCFKEYRNPNNLRKHIRQVHQQIYYQCKHCEKRFTKADGLRNHLFLHRDFFPYNCPACPRKFIQKYKFSAHLTTHNIKYDEKVHGYREQDNNMRQLIAECVRDPRNESLGVEITDDEPKLKRKKANFMTDTAASWHHEQIPQYPSFEEPKEMNFLL